MGDLHHAHIWIDAARECRGGGPAWLLDSCEVHDLGSGARSVLAPFPSRSGHHAWTPNAISSTPITWEAVAEPHGAPCGADSRAGGETQRSEDGSGVWYRAVISLGRALCSTRCAQLTIAVVGEGGPAQAQTVDLPPLREAQAQRLSVAFRTDDVWPVCAARLRLMAQSTQPGQGG